VNAFGDAAKQAGRASPEGEGNWAKSTFEDLVQYNDGFKTNLIGTPQQIAERIVALKAVGVDLVLAGFCTFRKKWSISASGCYAGKGAGGRSVVPPDRSGA
jgi:FMNH2-dependent dimethyl sulfone monooxygenase